MVIEHTTPVIRAPDLAYQDWDGCHECTQTADELQRALSKCSLEVLVLLDLWAALNGEPAVQISW